MFEVHVGDASVDTGSIPVRWCMDKESAERYAGHGYSVLLVARSLEGDEHSLPLVEVRQVCEVKDLVGYISFRKPGPTRIYAFILPCNKKKAKARYLLRRGRKFNWDLFNPYCDPRDDNACTYFGRRPKEIEDVEDDTDDESPVVHCEHCGHELEPEMDEDAMTVDGSVDDATKATVPPPVEYEDWIHTDIAAAAYIDVDVPREAFAPEPSRFDRAWVDLWHASPAVDQCEYRRRRINAYTPVLKPLAFLIYCLSIALGRTIAVTALALLGAGGGYHRCLTRPVSVSLDSVPPHGFFHTWTFDKTDEKSGEVGLLRYALTIASTPIVMIGATVPFLFMTDSPSSIYGWLLLPLVAFATVTTSLLAIFGLIHLLPDPRQERRIVRPEITPEELDFLTCGIAPGKVDLTALPAKRRTVKLYLAQAKSKVCRPFPA